MNNKGFTLIEILAITVIISMVALISFPIIGNVIEASQKNAAEVSANKFVEIVSNQADFGDDFENMQLTYDGEFIDMDSISAKSKPDTAELKLDENGNVYGFVTYGEYTFEIFGGKVQDASWDFFVDIPSGDLDFTFALRNPDLSIKWGDDGVSTEKYTDNRYVTHTYSTPGIYKVTVYGTVDRISFSTTEDTKNSCWSNTATPEKLNDITTKIPEQLDIKDLSTMFACVEVTGFTENNLFENILPNVTNLDSLFSGATNFNQDISSWDVSNVSNMSKSFREARAFNQNINNWNVSKVTDMSELFSGTVQFNQPLNNWDTSSVTNMQYMFRQSDFNQNINNWDTSSVNNIYGMFEFNTGFNQPLDSWDISNVIELYNVFSYATSFNQPLNNWDTSNITGMNSLFEDNFNQPLDNWDTSSVTYMFNVFGHRFNQDINTWDVSNVNEMKSMFGTDFNQPLDNWDVSSVTYMNGLFGGATSFNQDISSWDVSNVSNMSNMFLSATSFNQDLSGWCVTSITSEPTGFSTGTSSWILPKPVWGTCPGSGPVYSITHDTSTDLTPHNPDCLTATVCIDRFVQGPMYNQIVYPNTLVWYVMDAGTNMSSYTSTNDAMQGAELAIGTCSSPTTTFQGIEDLYDDFPSLQSAPLCLRTTAENMYFDMQIDIWDSGEMDSANVSGNTNYYLDQSNGTARLVYRRSVGTLTP